MAVPSKPKAQDRIVAAALDLFALRGYDATTIENIAEYAEVTPDVLARHFPNKGHILRDILSPTLQRIDRLLDRHGADPTASAVTLVEDLIDAIADSGPQVAALLDDPAVGHQVYTSAGDSALTERIELALTRELARAPAGAGVPKTVSRTTGRMRAASAAAAIPAAITAWQETNPATPIIDREARETLVDIVLAIITPARRRDPAP